MQSRLNLNYLKPWKEEFSRTERFLVTAVFLVASGYTAFTAWDMKTTLDEQGCERFVKEFGGVNESADLSFVDPEKYRNRYDVPENDFSDNMSFNYSRYRR